MLRKGIGEKVLYRKISQYISDSESCFLDSQSGGTKEMYLNNPSNQCMIYYTDITIVMG